MSTLRQIGGVIFWGWGVCASCARSLTRLASLACCSLVTLQVRASIISPGSGGRAEYITRAHAHFIKNPAGVDRRRSTR
jgi:hypothetical protein